MVSALNKAELESAHSRRIYFIYLNFAVSPFYACTGDRDYVWNSITWNGVGDISGISDIADAADSAARPVTITLTGVDAYVTDPIQSRTNYKGRAAMIYRGFLDSNDDLVDTPETRFSGLMDVGTMIRDENYVAQIVCEPIAARYLRAHISRYSDEDHQLRNPGDKFYEFQPQMEAKDVTWGGKRISPAAGWSGGSGGPIGPGRGFRRIF